MFGVSLELDSVTLFILSQSRQWVVNSVKGNAVVCYLQPMLPIELFFVSMIFCFDEDVNWLELTV